jgi:hypothetical protein
MQINRFVSWGATCTTGGRFMKVSLYKPGQPGLGFAYRPLHPHNSTMESEQLVVMGRAIECVESCPGCRTPT